MEQTALSFYKNKTSTFQTKLEYDPDTKVILIEYSGLANKDEIINVYKAAMKFAKENHVDGILQNSMDAKGTFTSANSFLKQEVEPFFNAYKLKCLFVAMSLDIFTRFAINQLLKIASTKYELKIFDEFATAKKALEAKLNVKLNW